jgi:hypothetical protein
MADNSLPDGNRTLSVEQLQQAVHIAGQLRAASTAVSAAAQRVIGARAASTS